MVVGVGIKLVELDLARMTRLMDLESNESSQDPPSHPKDATQQEARRRDRKREREGLLGGCMDSDGQKGGTRRSSRLLARSQVRWLASYWVQVRGNAVLI
jgi:hypothetical protein